MLFHSEESSFARATMLFTLCLLSSFKFFLQDARSRERMTVNRYNRYIKRTMMSRTKAKSKVS